MMMTHATKKRQFVLAISVMIAIAACSASSDIRYELGPEAELLDDAFYAAGYNAFQGQAYQDGRTVAFWAVKGSETSLFLVDLGQPSSWRSLAPNLVNSPAWPLRWTADGQYLIGMGRKVSAVTGESTSYGYHDACMTRMAAGNLMVYQNRHGYNTTADIMVVPVAPDGTVIGEPTQVTNFYLPENAVGIWADWFEITPDGSAIVFADYHQHYPQDISNIYILQNLPAILAAEKHPATNISSLAPTSADDPNLIAIRSSEPLRGLVACVPSFTVDRSTILYGEDWNSAFTNDMFWPTLALSDFDVMISNADGADVDVRLQQEGNQLFLTPVPGGSSLIYCRDIGGVMHLLATSLATATPVSGTVVENQVTVTEAQQVSDVSGTVLDIPPETVITFPPESTTQEITITTPIAEAINPELPQQLRGVPVLREFGPVGTTFSQPLSVTITYNDEQITGLDEANLKVFLYNPGTGDFTEVTTIIGRDTVNNTITFTVEHFSIYGVGSGNFNGGNLPLHVGLLPLCLLLAGTFALYRQRRRTEAPGQRTRN